MDLVLQFMPYSEIESLGSEERVSKLLKLAKQNKIIVLEGRLKKEEEAELIRRTMEQIDDKFKGIELGTIEPVDKESEAVIAKFKKNVINMLLGERRGITIIGPASIVKEIKQDPEKIQLLTSGKGALKVKPKKKKRRK